MCKVVVKASLVVAVFMAVLAGVQGKAAQSLVVINGVEYTADDYRNWWNSWKDPGMKFFDTPQQFIDFKLLVEQARQMEYYDTPAYQRKVEVFLLVRALAMLKQEEVDAKVLVTEEEIREEFQKRYAPRWFVQILSFEDLATAERVFEEMKKYEGQKAGRLIFADYAGVKPEDGGASKYGELDIYPAKLKNDKDFWLGLLKDLKEKSVSKPKYLESFKQYIVVRMDEISQPDEKMFEEKRGTVLNDLNKESRDRLSAELVERLIKKYHVVVHEEFAKSLSSQEDYSPEILRKPVVEMDDLVFTARDLLENVERERILRRTLSDEQLKNIVINNLVSQKVTDKEALSRHYENLPRIKAVYDFYKENALRKFLLADMRGNIEISDQEIQKYYQDNLSQFTMEGELSYALVQGDRDLLETMSREITKGGNFFNEAKKLGLNAKLKTEVDKIREAGEAEQLAILKVGETTPPFPYRMSYAIIKLLKRDDDSLLPLDKVNSEIKKRLVEEKFAKMKRENLEKLKSVSTIKVNQGVWSQLKKEYEDEKS